MKATIEISDELYRRVEERCSLQGRSVDDVVAELFRHWLDEVELPVRRAPAWSPPDPAAPVEVRRRAVQAWLDEWLSMDGKAPANAPGPSAREILDADRSRLEHRWFDDDHQR